METTNENATAVTALPVPDSSVLTSSSVSESWNVTVPSSLPSATTFCSTPSGLSVTHRHSALFLFSSTPK